MSRIICPVCGTPTAFTPIFISPERVYDYEVGIKGAAVDGRIVKAEMPQYRNGTKYAILLCQSCTDIFVAMTTYSTEWHSVYPIMRKPVLEDIPQPIKSEFEEAQLCYAVGAYRACVSMCQISVEHVWHEQHVSGLSELKEKGIIPPRLYDRANEIRLWGNLEKHNLINESVTLEDGEQLLSYVEIILNEVYIEPKRLDTLAKKRKALEKKD